jgi:peptide/nickel transport system substrate-binding protein
MNEQGYWQRRRYTRRGVLRAGALGTAGLAGLAMLGCSSKQPAGGASTSSAGGTAAQRPQAGGTLNAYNNFNVGIFDPQGGSGASSNVLINSVYSHPFQYKLSTDPQTYLQYEVQADIAVSGESPDGQTWTLKLQPNGKFHSTAPVNGHAVEAEDVKASFTRAFAKPENSLKSLIPMIDPAQIQTPDAQTVVLKLKYPYGPFRETLTGGGTEILPREALVGSYDPLKTVIGSGPFVFDSFTPDVALGLKKNPTWYRSGLPYVDQVRAAIITDPATQVAQFTAGNLDVLHPPPNDLATVKQQNPKATILSQVGSSWAFLGHMNLPDSPWHDIRIRQAVSMALDRTAIKKVIFNNQYSDNQIIPAAVGKWMLPLDKFGDAQQYYQFNPDAVKKLLAATAGGPQLTRFLYPAKQYGAAFDSMAETITSMLNQAGFKIQLVAIDYNKDFIGGGKGALYGAYPPDALLFSADVVFANAEETLNSHFQSQSARNKPQVSDPDLDQMLAKMESTVDDASRLQQALDVQKYLAGKIYQISMPDALPSTAIQPSVHNFYVASSGGGAADTSAFPQLWLKR